MTFTRLVTALAVAAALAGCSGEPEPKVAPSESSSASASVKPSDPTPSHTATATAELDPEETVRAWIEARNQALADGETGPAEALSGSSCDSCLNLLNSIRKVYRAGGNIRSDGWTVESTRIASQRDQRTEVRAAIRFAAGQTIPSANAEPISFAAENHLMTFDLIRGSAGWRLSVVGFIS